MKRNPPSAAPATIMAAIRHRYSLTVKQAWRVYKLLRHLLNDEPLSLRKLTTHAQTLHEAAHRVAPSRVVVSRLPEEPAPVPRVRLPDFPEEVAPALVVPKNPKAFHAVTTRLTGPANSTPETLRNTWWRIASGNDVTVFRIRVVNWRKRQWSHDDFKEYVYEELEGADALQSVKAMAIVRGGKRSLRVSRVAWDEGSDIAEFEVTLFYWEQA